MTRNNKECKKLPEDQINILFKKLLGYEMHLYFHEGIIYHLVYGYGGFFFFKIGSSFLSMN
jgi:hypothetical protein